MNTRHITIVILWIVAIGLTLWDLYAFRTPVRGDTISEVIRERSAEWLIIPFAAGMLCGHLFWRN